MHKNNRLWSSCSFQLRWFQPGKFQYPDYANILAELVCDFGCLMKTESVTVTLTLKLSTLKGLSGLRGKSVPELLCSTCLNKSYFSLRLRGRNGNLQISTLNKQTALITHNNGKMK